MRLHAPAFPECREESGDSDLIRLAGDDHLAVYYEDFERTGPIGVSRNTSIYAGGDFTSASWLRPEQSAQAIAADIRELLGKIDSTDENAMLPAWLALW